METEVSGPDAERERLHALRTYEILDTPTERTFDRITSLAAEVFDVPLALITLVDETRSWWKSHLGTDVDRLDREISPCNLVIRQNDVVVVPDATLDSVYGELASLKAFGVRFYAAAPLQNEDGFNLGTLCVADPTRPHSCGEREKQILADLAALVMDELELRRAARRIVESDRELMTLNQRLEEGSRNKSDFLARMSHELRTPLNAIMGASELLEGGRWGTLSEKQLEYVRYIRDGGDHLLSLINDVLDIAKVESGTEELHLEAISLHALLESSAATARAAGAPKNLTVDIEAPGPDVVFEADERKLKQVLFNVLSNAMKFSPTSGHVRLMAGSTMNEIIFSVEDQGPGIAPDLWERIFEEFYRVEGSAGSSQSGTGLGLAVAKRLVQLHGGRLWVAASGPAGSRFSLAVPYRSPP